jgi:hypothetical protein
MTFLQSSRLQMSAAAEKRVPPAALPQLQDLEGTRTGGYLHMRRAGLSRKVTGWRPGGQPTGRECTALIRKFAVSWVALDLARLITGLRCIIDGLALAFRFD